MENRILLMELVGKLNWSMIFKVVSLSENFHFMNFSILRFFSSYESEIQGSDVHLYLKEPL